MTLDPTSPYASYSASSPADASPSSYAATSEAEKNQRIDQELESQLENLRGSFDERAAELGRRTAKVRDALDFSERIREQPLLAVGLGVAAGAVTALIRPRLGSGLLALLAMRAGREVASRMLERVFHMLVEEHQGRSLEQSSPLHTRGYTDAELG